jgi:hypothetical protein
VLQVVGFCHNLSEHYKLFRAGLLCGVDLKRRIMINLHLQWKGDLLSCLFVSVDICLVIF